MNTSSLDREIISARLLAAPPASIVGAFRDPALLARWWGPKGFSNTIHEFDFRPGGTWRLVMHGPDGTDYPNHWEFQEIGPERLVMRHIDPSHGFLLTVTLAAAPGGTEVIWHMLFDDAGDCARSMAFVPQCNEELFDRLEAVLATFNRNTESLEP